MLSSWFFIKGIVQLCMLLLMCACLLMNFYLHRSNSVPLFSVRKLLNTFYSMYGDCLLSVTLKMAASCAVAVCKPMNMQSEYVEDQPLPDVWPCEICLNKKKHTKFWIKTNAYNDISTHTFSSYILETSHETQKSMSKMWTFWRISLISPSLRRHSDLINAFKWIKTLIQALK